MDSLFSSVLDPLKRYANWLHLQWPDSTPEKLPEIGARGSTGMPEIRLAGDLLGVPLLKMAAQTGADAIRAFVDDGLPTQVAVAGREPLETDFLDLVIVGGGVSGISAALEAKKLGVRFLVLEAREAFATISDFTKGKPIFTYPTQFVPDSSLKLTGKTKESLLLELRTQAAEAKIPFRSCRVREVKRLSEGKVEIIVENSAGVARSIYARRALVCVGRSGDYRKLGVPGENLTKVTHRLFDPADYADKSVLVVGGGDQALEAAIALEKAGADVHMSYRRSEFIRAKSENIEEAMALLKDRIYFSTEVEEITEDAVQIRSQVTGDVYSLENDAVFALIGRDAPHTFLKRSGIKIHGEWDRTRWVSFIIAFLAILFIYRIKTEGSEVYNFFNQRGLFPLKLSFEEGSLAKKLIADPLAGPGFYYELLYTAVILGFGIRRIRKYPSPYIRKQTLTLMMVQLIPLLLVPYLFLPLIDHFGGFDSGIGKTFADALFPLPEEGGARPFWRAVGFILAWPLFIWNIYTAEPMWGWLGISLFQTFVIIPWIVIKYGKGAYCGWICSCGAMAETLGDATRTEMPHGRKWNLLNMAGQAILLLSLIILALRVFAWAFPEAAMEGWLGDLYVDLLAGGELFGVPFNYSTSVDYFLSGVLGMGLYFHFSGRTWCRFFCPLAALMHIYARFSKFRIFSQKEKCISCGVCTRVCHQGIDVAAFAVRGMPMEDPQCVRCSACVYHCPTGTLSFGTLEKDGTWTLDKTVASAAVLKENGVIQ